jgi:hypothetical protein
MHGKNANYDFFSLSLTLIEFMNETGGEKYKEVLK